MFDSFYWLIPDPLKVTGILIRQIIVVCLLYKQHLWYDDNKNIK